jgi:hypothetical protein
MLCVPKLFLIAALALLLDDGKVVTGFSLLLMGRKGKGNLKRTLMEEDTAVPKSSAGLNQGRGQEITGVSLPQVVRVNPTSYLDCGACLD